LLTSRIRSGVMTDRTKASSLLTKLSRKEQFLRSTQEHRQPKDIPNVFCGKQIP
jgi:hypothetical protein